MRGVRICAVLMLAIGAAGCAGTPDNFEPGDLAVLRSPGTDGARIETPRTPLECVPYARARSGIALYGDAGTWWVKAQGRYRRAHTPRRGAVIVLTGYAGPGRGHVAVVRTVDSAREIRLDHANWLGDGAIYLNDPAVDVSPGNDWSELRVWNARTHNWGIRTYLVEGFIGPEPLGGTDRVAAR